ncbi:MAG: hypothetical protein WHS90_05220 [Caldilinea sp.]|jgi:hypothetical protein|uniref:hypothetical protein n=1 Tax=Caldilinea sp. TaxID=2293560 RepID=UPI0030AC4389
MSRRSRRDAADAPKPQLRWEAALFAFATNMLLVTVLTGFVQTMPLPIEFEVLATVGGPLLAGALTAFYARHRGGMHAFLGGMLSVLPLTFFIFQGNWQPALYAGAFCTMGGALTEVVQRRFQRTRKT